MFLNRELRGRNLAYGAREYSLTFDDGPSPEVTGELAQYLHGEGVCATFFVLGERAAAPLLKKIAALGHKIGNHTFSHQNLDQYRGDHRAEIERQILDCHQRIEAFTGTARIPFRAPGGAWSDPRFSRFANALPVAKRYIGRYGWDIDANDWRLLRRQGDPLRISFETYCRRFAQAIESFRGGIVLLHDGFPANEAHLTDPRHNRALEVARFALATLRSQGFRCVPLKEPPLWRECLDWM